MKKHRTHQTDEDAQYVFLPSLPLPWGKNELKQNDYGKDYLIEIGDVDGEQTGNSFYVQLKGQERSRLNRRKTAVCFVLKKMHALYFADRIKDLPIFLVIVNVQERIPRYLFLQPALTDDERWRGKGSLTLEIPLENKVADTATFRRAVEDAKQWMRVNHPASIADAIEARKQKVRKDDPRFIPTVTVSADGKINTHLDATEEVSMSFTGSTGHNPTLVQKFDDAFNKGLPVAFAPGEIVGAGSKIIEEWAKKGGILQASIELDVACTLISYDDNGKELGRLGEIPGKVTGGRTELRFEGSLNNSPVTLKVGPIAVGSGGTITFTMSFHKWDGHPLRELAFFDRIHSFFQTVLGAARFAVDLQKDGNEFFTVNIAASSLPSMVFLQSYLESIHKARVVCKRLGISPVWRTSEFNEAEIETAEQLFALMNDGVWETPVPRCEIKFSLPKKEYDRTIAKVVNKMSDIMVSNEKWHFSLFGTPVATLLLTSTFRQGVFIINQAEMTRKRTNARTDAAKRRLRSLSPTSRVPILFEGRNATIREVRLDDGTTFPDETTNAKNIAEQPTKEDN
jgi:hypothetical protein